MRIAAHLITLALLLALLSGFCRKACCQEPADTLKKNGKDCQPKDIFEVILRKPLIEMNEEKKVNFIVIPFLGYAPATGLQFGAGASVSFRTAMGTRTNLSAINAQAYYTVKNQLVTQIRSNIYTNGNKWFLQGDWRFYLFQQPTYGLGTRNQPFQPESTDPPGTKVDEELDGKYNMDYNWLKFHETLSRKITNNILAGIGYHFDYHFGISDKALHTYNDTLYTTPHYSYCTRYGFDNQGYISSGLSVNFVFDSRDNIINAYKGFYVNANYRYNFRWLGSNEDGSLLWTEFRTYVGLSKKMPRHLLAFWAYGSFQTSGKIAYLDLMSNAFDPSNSSGRGYSQGRWRGQDFAYGELEYRFPISQCSQVLGGVLFVNVITASDRDNHVPLFGYLEPAAGVGLRVMVIKEDRTNISFDYAVGKDGSGGFYFQIQEIF